MKTNTHKLYLGATHAREPRRTISSWVGQTQFDRSMIVDFDGVLCTYRGWRGPNVFGKPISGASRVLHDLEAHGWRIYIFTSRLVTWQMIKWLHDADIPWHDINGRCGWDKEGKYIRLQRYDRASVDYSSGHRLRFWEHQPEYASIKPLGSVILDDMNWENNGKNYTRETWNTIHAKLLGMKL